MLAQGCEGDLLGWDRIWAFALPNLNTGGGRGVTTGVQRLVEGRAQHEGRPPARVILEVAALSGVLCSGGSGGGIPRS